ncbi:hypothetical protein J4V19_24525 [Escherichia coli]
MSYSVMNQDGVHMCDIPLSVYQVIRRQSLSAGWLHREQGWILVKVLLVCGVHMCCVLSVIWICGLVVIRRCAPDRSSYG